MINVAIRIRMTKKEVERDILPTMEKPPGSYFYWWNNILVLKFPLEDGEMVEAPCLLTKENMLVEVVDEEDIYKPPADFDDCNCPLCTGDFDSLL